MSLLGLNAWELRAVLEILNSKPKEEYTPPCDFDCKNCTLEKRMEIEDETDGFDD